MRRIMEALWRAISSHFANSWDLMDPFLPPMSNHGPIVGPTNRRNMSEITYGFVKKMEGATYDEAVERVTAGLKEGGFGVLTEIDVKATLKKKIDADFRRYIILGACNPNLAHKALQAESQLGLLLPCNVVVQEDEAGDVVVSVVDPRAMFKLVENPELDAVAADVANMLSAVLDAL